MYPRYSLLHHPSGSRGLLNTANLFKRSVVITAKKKDSPPELLLYNFEIAFAKVMNYPKNKQYQVDLIRYEKELLRRLGGDYEVFCKCDQIQHTSNDKEE